ncbi:MAG: hypothetical protein U5K79_13095 [Cyclobacteriaceae bacterium]|nr:hypothetical protein [Cyclobacteriaceae bacterium]
MMAFHTKINFSKFEFVLTGTQFNYYIVCHRKLWLFFSMVWEWSIHQALWMKGGKIMMPTSSALPNGRNSISV